MNNRLSSKYRIKIVSFYCLMVLILMGWVGLSLIFAFWILSFSHDDWRLLILALFPIFYAIFAIIVFTTYKPHRSRGITVTKEDAPQLFDLIAGVTGKMDYQGEIDKVILTPGMSVSVSFDPNISNFMFGSKANLFVGVSLCRVLSKDELSAVIAHELAHFSQPQTKYKAYLARISNIASRLGRNGVFASDNEFNPFIFGLYALPARLFCRVFSYLFESIFDINSADYLAVSAEMELEADKISAQAFGRDSMLSALCKTYGTSCRLTLYKQLVLPYISSYGYRCNGFWDTFEATSSLYYGIDNLVISNNKPLLDFKRIHFDLSECIFALRLDALEKIPSDMKGPSWDRTSLDIIPSDIQMQMDKFLCRKYDQTSGLPIGKVRLKELVDELRAGLFYDVHSMPEAFILLNKLLEAKTEEVVTTQEIMPEYAQPSFDVLPQPVIRQASEVIYSSSIDQCPVCGHVISEDTKICPHCHEIISE